MKPFPALSCIALLALLPWCGVAQTAPAPAEPVVPGSANQVPGGPGATPAVPAAGELMVPADPDDYAAFIRALISRAHVTDLVVLMDRLIDDAEAQQANNLPMRAVGTSRLGIALELRVVESEQAILYQLTLSRGGRALRYDDAVKIAALFVERCGLTHPLSLKEGERPVFYSQWLFKPEDWKAVREVMLETRRQNRAQRDLLKVFATAITRELNAREQFHQPARK